MCYNPLNLKWDGVVMRFNLLFVGNKFSNNIYLKNYVLREVEKKFSHINSITFFQENDNSLFLYLEKEVSSEIKLLIVTTKQNFSVVGKLLCTITGDNLILKDNMLLPSQCNIFDEQSYLLELHNSKINILHVDELTKFPNILLEDDHSNGVIHLFREDKESAKLLLSPIAQTNEVKIEFTEIADGWLQINIRSRRYGNITQFVSSAKQLLNSKIITAPNIPAYIIEKLEKANKKVTFAESCTGGLLAYMFTKESGASNIFDGSLITYSNALKENWLAVEHITLENNGAVSANVVQEMSEGAINVSYADYSIAVSGIAGPTGGTQDKPVGTVYISARSQENENTHMLLLSGDRKYIQTQSALYAIKMLLEIDKEFFFTN